MSGEGLPSVNSRLAGPAEGRRVPMTEIEAKQKLIDAGLILDAADQGDLTRGHVSLRVPDDPTHFFMKPHSQGLDEITLENIVVCNLEGEKVGGGIGKVFGAETVQRLHHNITRQEQYTINFDYLRRRALRARR